MKVAIVGTVVYDTVISYNKSIHHGFGGITFNALAFGKLLKGKEAEIFPISTIGEDRYDDFLKLVERFPNIKSNGLILNADITAQSQLTYFSSSDREERLLYPNPPLTLDLIAPFRDSDIFLINFISGDDISLWDLRSLRKISGALFYMDLHCLTMEKDSEGVKSYRYLSNWEEWVANCDIVQMNFTELESLFRDKVYINSLENLTAEILEAGPRIAIVTLGENGVFIAFREKLGNVNFKRILAQEKELAIDPTGCGDVFSAAFGIKYYETSDPMESGKFANKIAGKNAQFKGNEWFLTE